MPTRKPGSRPHAAAADQTGALPHVTADRVLQQFRIVFNAVKTHFQQVERQSGVGGAQVWALSLIRDRPGIGVGDLAIALNVRQPTASNLVRNLAQQELIVVRREGPDRRAVQLHATTEGRKVLRRTTGPFAGVLPEALVTLEEESLEQLEKHLGVLIKHLGADERSATKPLAQL